MSPKCVAMKAGFIFDRCHLPTSLPESPIFLKLSVLGVGISTSCPASGRIVYFPRDNYLEIVVADFL